MQQLMFQDDQQFWFETQRKIGQAVYGGSDVGEVIATASQVTSGDYDGWHNAWLSTAERLDAEARASHPVSARTDSCALMRLAVARIFDWLDDTI
ncbi:MAG: hypothetical protein ACJ72W_23920 [Actinoallomurus sp.]